MLYPRVRRRRCSRRSFHWESGPYGSIGFIGQAYPRRENNASMHIQLPTCNPADAGQAPGQAVLQPRLARAMARLGDQAERLLWDAVSFPYPSTAVLLTITPSSSPSMGQHVRDDWPRSCPGSLLAQRLYGAPKAVRSRFACISRNALAQMYL